MLALILAFTLVPVEAGYAGTPSEADELTSSEEADLRLFWDGNGVPGEVQDGLIGKLLSGDLWDVFTGVDPVSSRTVHVGGEQRTIDSYPDGSISVTTIETPQHSQPVGGVSPQYVKNCRSTTSGTGYVNHYDCQAFSQTGVVSIGFYISYSTLAGYDQIIGVSSPYGDSSFGVLDPDPPMLTLVKRVETSSGSAWAKARTTYKTSGGSSSATVEMRALVGNNTAWTRWESGL